MNEAPLDLIPLNTNRVFTSERAKIEFASQNDQPVIPTGLTELLWGAKYNIRW